MHAFSSDAGSLKVISTDQPTKYAYATIYALV